MISLDSGFFLASSSSNLSFDEVWDLTSTYYRRFNLINLKKSINEQQPTQEQFQDYHENLIKDAKSYHYHKEKLSNLELLLELQH
jgi:hypothetical protein